MSIAVLAALSAIIFAIARTAIEAGQRTSCSSNLSNLSKALLLYVSDHDERGPSFAWEGGRANNFPRWQKLILPYTKQTKLLCSQRVHRDYNHAKIANLANGYALNRGLLENASWESSSNVVLLTESEVFDLEDNSDVAIDPLDTLALPDVLELRPLCIMRNLTGFCEQYPWGALRHRGGANIAFLDGHLSWAEPSRFRIRHIGSGTIRFWYSGPSDGPRFHLEE